MQLIQDLTTADLLVRLRTQDNLSDTELVLVDRLIGALDEIDRLVEDFRRVSAQYEVERVDG